MKGGVNNCTNVLTLSWIGRKPAPLPKQGERGSNGASSGSNEAKMRIISVRHGPKTEPGFGRFGLPGQSTRPRAVPDDRGTFSHRPRVLKGTGTVLLAAFRFRFRF